MVIVRSEASISTVAWTRVNAPKVFCQEEMLAKRKQETENIDADNKKRKHKHEKYREQWDRKPKGED